MKRNLTGKNFIFSIGQLEDEKRLIQNGKASNSAFLHGEFGAVEVYPNHVCVKSVGRVSLNGVHGDVEELHRPMKLDHGVVFAVEVTTDAPDQFQVVVYGLSPFSL